MRYKFHFINQFYDIELDLKFTFYHSIRVYLSKIY